MKAINNYWGQTKAWWVVLLIGVLMVICGFAYWIWPAAGYAVSSQIFGWMLVLAGIVQLCQAAGPNRGSGWGWWLVGGVIDLFIGFMLVRSIVLSEEVFPYFLAIVFIFWGMGLLFSAVSGGRKYWWLSLIDSILMIAIGFFFIEAGWVQNMMMISFLTSLAFIYWGFSIAMLSYEMRPKIQE
ncbi:MAG: DUF308 domain-containing protein [Paramuribaculum sp.]|nr:DUF308 domain-containing protein [Paramuribaculum sp.]